MIILICNFVLNAQNPCIVTNYVTPDVSGPPASERGMKCVRIKFHFLSYPGGNSSVPSDEYYRKRLAELNLVYNLYNINFVMEDCVSRVNTNLDLPHVGNFGPFINASPQKVDALNVYSYELTSAQNGISSPGSNIGISAPYGFQLIHEVGHMLGLNHTHATFDYNTVLAPSLRECTNARLDLGDGIPDTGADPWSMNYLLPNSSINDKSHWVISGANGCTINPELFGKNDECNQNAWNIPFKNYMSYYESCNRNEFTPDQVKVMHNRLEGSSVLVPCPVEETDCTSPTIYINGNVIWEAQHVQLCKDQKVIINPNSTLTIKNTHVSKKTTNPTCPGISKTGNWDGIYVMSNANLYINNSSIVENSNNGIVCNSCNLVKVDHSTLKENHAAIKAQNARFGVQIVNASIIDASAGTAAKQIAVYNSVTSILGSKIQGPDNLIGVYSTFGKLTVNNSTIKYFDIAIYKDVDLESGSSSPGFGPAPSSSGGAGLFMTNSDILNYKTNTLLVYTWFISVKKCLLHGAVYTRSKNTAKWLSNQFTGYREVSLGIGPELDNLFQNNYFNSSNLQLYGNEAMTNVICNKWNVVNTAVYFASEQGMDWGSKVVSSGNKNSRIPSLPLMTSSAYNITNWEYTENSNPIPWLDYKFSYGGNFRNDYSDFPNYNCLYDYRTMLSSPPVIVNDACDPVIYENQYQTQNNLYASIQEQIAISTDTTIIHQLDQASSQAQFNRSFTASSAIGCILDDETESYNNQFQLWRDRLSPELNFLNTVANYWKIGDFTSLNSLVAYSNNTSVDFSAMQTAASILASYQSQQISIYELNTNQLSDLINIASNQFGDYTNQLRAWLAWHYNIFIPIPLGSAPFTPLKAPVATAKEKEQHYFIMPNPSDDCFAIQNINGGDVHELKVTIIDINGKTLYTQNMTEFETFCVKSILKPDMYFIKIEDIKTNKSYYHKMLIR